MGLAGVCVIHPDFGGEHLCIFLTDYADYGKNQLVAVIVNVTSWREHKDQTLILQPGDHDFITKKSVIAYDNACLLQEWQVSYLKVSNNLLPLKNYCLELAMGFSDRLLHHAM